MSDKKLGRPPEYKPEYVNALVHYFSDSEPEQNEYGEVKTKDFPTLAGFAVKVGVHRETLLEWSKDPNKPDFSDAYDRAKAFQENYLLVNGLKGKIAPLFGIFVAKSICGLRDKQPGEEAAVNINNNNFVHKTTEELEARFEEIVRDYKKEQE